MQLISLADIFEDNSTWSFRNRFSKRDEKDVACFKETKEISIYISLAQSIRQPWKLSLGTTTLKSFVSHTGLWQTLEKLDDLEKYRANATSNLWYN